MIELNAPSFLGAATSLARIHQVFSGLSAANDEKLIPESVALVLPAVRLFEAEAQAIGARLASVSAHRFMASLEQHPCGVTVGQATIALHDIESRFADYLSEIKLFTLSAQEAPFMGAVDELLQSEGFSILFPSASFEVEEAAKCIALGRYTASVFHAMRMLEIGIRSLSKRLGIPDPSKPSEKNWGKILSAIKSQIDQLWPTNSRLPGSEGVAFEGLYAHLDAVRNPWRNATMHVETIYAPHEALHIIRCAAYFMTELSRLTDEDGSPPPSTPSPQLADP